MSTINGVGTFHYGKHDVRSDGSYVATVFLVVFFLPIVPLRSERLIHHGVDGEVATLEILARLPIQWHQALAAYVRGWIIMPLLLLWPVIGLGIVAGVIHATSGKPATSAFMQRAMPIFGACFAVYFIGMAAYLLYRARR